MAIFRKAKLFTFNDDGRPVKPTKLVDFHYACNDEAPLGPVLEVSLPDVKDGIHQTVDIPLKALLAELGLPWIYDEMVIEGEEE